MRVPYLLKYVVNIIKSISSLLAISHRPPLREEAFANYNMLARKTDTGSVLNFSFLRVMFSLLVASKDAYLMYKGGDLVLLCVPKPLPHREHHYI